MQNEWLNKYDGAIEQWKINLAVSRIKAMGFPKDDWPDLVQKLAIVILEFRFDPAKANGAKEETALYAAINNHLKCVLRSRCRERAKMKRHRRNLGLDDDAATAEQKLSYCENIPLGMDVRAALESMPPFDQAVCMGLSKGMLRQEIARKLDCDWHTVNAAIPRIRKHLKALGLDGWMRQ